MQHLREFVLLYVLSLCFRFPFMPDFQTLVLQWNVKVCHGLVHKERIIILSLHRGFANKSWTFLLDRNPPLSLVANLNHSRLQNKVLSWCPPEWLFLQIFGCKHRIFVVFTDWEFKQTISALLNLRLGKISLVYVNKILRLDQGNYRRWRCFIYCEKHFCIIVMFNWRFFNILTTVQPVWIFRILTCIAKKASFLPTKITPCLA